MSEPPRECPGCGGTNLGWDWCLGRKAHVVCEDCGTAGPGAEVRNAARGFEAAAGPWNAMPRRSVLRDTLTDLEAGLVACAARRLREALEKKR